MKRRTCVRDAVKEVCSGLSSRSWEMPHIRERQPVKCSLHWNKSFWSYMKLWGHKPKAVLKQNHMYVSGAKERRWVIEVVYFILQCLLDWNISLSMVNVIYRRKNIGNTGNVSPIPTYSVLAFSFPFSYRVKGELVSLPDLLGEPSADRESWRAVYVHWIDLRRRVWVVPRNEILPIEQLFLEWSSNFKKKSALPVHGILTFSSGTLLFSANLHKVNEPIKPITLVKMKNLRIRFIDT